MFFRRIRFNKRAWEWEWGSQRVRSSGAFSHRNFHCLSCIHSHSWSGKKVRMVWFVWHDLFTCNTKPDEMKDEPYDHWLCARAEPELQKAVDNCQSKIMPLLKVALVGNKNSQIKNPRWSSTHLPEKQRIVLPRCKLHHYHCLHVGLVGKNLWEYWNEGRRYFWGLTFLVSSNQPVPSR